LEMLKLFKVQSLISDNQVQVQEIRLNLLRAYCELEVSAGFKERAVALLHSLLEVSLARLKNSKVPNLLDLYEEFCDNEYPRIGEMRSYNGF
jgi:NRDE-2, necessary for RNA interference